MVVLALALTWCGRHGGARLRRCRRGQAGATDIGVTKDEIRLAVVADVDNPFKPGLFQGAVDGVKAAVKEINATGGVAGRKLKVDFIDSKLNASTTRNAIITACDEDFAMVGTAAAFLTNVEDETGCKDQAGQRDRAARPRVVRHRRAAVLTGGVPRQPVVARLRHEGRAPADVLRVDRCVGVVQGADQGRRPTACTWRPTTAPSRQRAQDLLYEFPKKLGMKADQHPYVSSTAPQSAYTPIVQKMKADNSNFVYAQGRRRAHRTPPGGAAAGRRRRLRQVALQQLLQQGAPVGEPDRRRHLSGPRMSCRSRRRSTTRTSRTLVKNVGDGTLDQFAVYGFAATMLFRQAAEAAVAEHGADGLTRANLLAAAVEDPQVRRRRDDRRERHRWTPVRSVLHGDADPEREVGARVPEEAGNVRLHGQEPHSRSRSTSRPADAPGEADGARRQGRGDHRRIDRHRTRDRERLRRPRHAARARARGAPTGSSPQSTSSPAGGASAIGIADRHRAVPTTCSSWPIARSTRSAVSTWPS